MMKPLAAGLAVELKQSRESSKVAESLRSESRGVLTAQSPLRIKRSEELAAGAPVRPPEAEKNPSALTFRHIWDGELL